eukprot:CAMPEP_0194445674 /NCGR_PEP_ID=MMETSP0176-20130528/128000_1 /TAXON_ID=216777 /ORGANISM="Proboscia alata, Strain PI-D3" /LENGTH=154 /DNA_ID=CAMNT_0039272275 /DNA_START=786 /DNA_END=1250 /DNA_ORIENTATION=+
MHLLLRSAAQAGRLAKTSRSHLIQRGSGAVSVDSIVGECFLTVMVDNGCLPKDLNDGVISSWTLYPTIKTYHNVGGIPARMKLKRIEPLRECFKDEDHELGKNMRINESNVWRPSPSPKFGGRDRRTGRDPSARWIDFVRTIVLHSNTQRGSLR